MKKLLFLLFLIVLPLSGTAVELDPEKYITLDEIEPGMEAYCKTIYNGLNVEKFDLKVLAVVRNYQPGRNAIMVMGLDPRFIHTGPVAGCSGSPVYIDGRLAGALAFGWSYSKDPLYGVTPIEEMLEVGEGTKPELFLPVSVYDLSKPLDVDEIVTQMKKLSKPKFPALSMAEPLPSPLVCSGFSSESIDEFRDFFEPFGLIPVTGSGVQTASVYQEAAGKAELKQGSTLSVPLVSGDISLASIGTVTDVRGDQVFAFGHSFFGSGPVDLPMATGVIHTVVSSVVRSFKFGSPLEVVGSLRADEAAAIRGVIGAEPQTVPLLISVDRYNDFQKREYNCQVAVDKNLTPLLVASATSGAISMLGELPKDHTIKYSGQIELENYDPVEFENMATMEGPGEFLQAVMATTTLLLNNPWDKPKLKSFKLYANVDNRNAAARIWSMNVSDDEVKPGETITIDIVLEGYSRIKDKYVIELTIPEGTKPGNYELSVMGGQMYDNFLKRNASHKFIPQNMESLIDSLNETLNIENGKLYATLSLPPSGIVIERSELPGLPQSKSMMLLDNKRPLQAKPQNRWILEEVETDSVVMDKKTVNIKVK